MSEDDRLVGTLVADRYRVGRKLGEGGMGLVYLAVHEKLHKTVALKVLATSARLQKEAIARFEREAIAAANLKHPNIAEASDFGQLPDGGLYIVMEYVEGTTLRQLIGEKGKLPPERALAILKQVAAALSAAHARDVVHRDLKPENVVVSSTDGVKVIDFGIAKLRSETFGGGGTGLTKSGTVFGTPEYMSPEQVMGQAVDARADQYALGVLAFELLTGKAPFKTADVSQLMMMHVGAPVPSTRDLTPALPPAVDAVIERTLGKLPEERFASVADAIAALESALSTPVLVPVPLRVPEIAPAPASAVWVPPPGYVTSAPIPTTTLASPVRDPHGSRNLSLLVIGAGAAVLLIGVIGVIVAFLVRSPETTDEHAMPPDDAPPSAAGAPPPAAGGKGKAKGKKK